MRYSSLALLATLQTVNAFAEELQIPHQFESGKAALATQVNENFSQIETVVNTTSQNVERINNRLTTIETASGSTDGNTSIKLSGLVTVPSNSNAVVGQDSLFTRELNVGDAIRIGEEVFTVTAIENDLSLSLSAPHIAGALSSEAYVDDKLLSISTGAGEQRVSIDKSGNLVINNQLIRKVYRASALGPAHVIPQGNVTSELVSQRTLTFKKLLDASAIRIQYGDNFRVTKSTTAHACEWEVLIDGQSCGFHLEEEKNTSNSDKLIYHFYGYATDSNHYVASTQYGFCENIPAGEHTITIAVTNRVGKYAGADCHTGWSNSRWTIEAEEVY